MGRTWSNEEVERLRELHARGLCDAEIAEHFPGRSGSAVRQKRADLGLPGNGLYSTFRMTHSARVVSETPERIVFAPSATNAEPIEDLWERALRRTARAVERSRTEGVALVQIVADKPVAISISSDWHVSTTGATDLAGLRAYAERIQREPGAFAITVGDLADNPIKWTKNMLDVPDEWRIVGHLFAIFGLKMLGATSGNHDDWSAAFAGVEPLRELAERGKVHFAPDELTYIIEIIHPRTRERTARYCIATRHKYYRHSNLNPTHACFRWLEDRIGQWPVLEDGGELVPDVLAIGHNHVACCEERTFENRNVWGCRMGAWQLTTGHGRAGGWRRSPPTAPTCILYPTRERPIWMSPHYQVALDMLARERAEWRDAAA